MTDDSSDARSFLEASASTTASALRLAACSTWCGTSDSRGGSWQTQAEAARLDRSRDVRALRLGRSAVGVKVFYIESVTRIEGPSLTCRLVRRSPTASTCSGPSCSRVRGSIYVGSVFPHDLRHRRLEQSPSTASCGRSTGCREEDLVVQHGASAVRPRHAECVDFLDYDEFVGPHRQARVVVTHAGVGSVMTALAHGRRPLVVPRRVDFGEAVDDHQLTFARRADELGLVTLVEDVSDLAAISAYEADTWPQLRRAARSRSSCGPTSRSRSDRA